MGWSVCVHVRPVCVCMRALSFPFHLSLIETEGEEIVSLAPLCIFFSRFSSQVRGARGHPRAALAHLTLPLAPLYSWRLGHSMFFRWVWLPGPGDAAMGQAAPRKRMEARRES